MANHYSSELADFNAPTSGWFWAPHDTIDSGANPAPRALVSCSVKHSTQFLGPDAAVMKSSLGLNPIEGVSSIGVLYWDPSESFLRVLHQYGDVIGLIL